MGIVDPENIETRALHDFVDFSGKHILEIGCGDGRVTWRYAETAAHVIAIDPSARQIDLAKEQQPAHLKDRIEFQDVAFEDFAAANPPSAFDLVILAQSLC
jgi:2-polyprenyl-3-methyl-5-hydroxy-6-metoxy-1,4-benzoquinol methylase